MGWKTRENADMAPAYAHRAAGATNRRATGTAPATTRGGDEDSALLVDATLKGDMPPIALPKRQYTEEAKAIWEDRLGLPTQHPRAPWFGYDLGAWNEDLERQAQLAEVRTAPDQTDP